MCLREADLMVTLSLKLNSVKEMQKQDRLAQIYLEEPLTDSASGMSVFVTTHHNTKTDEQSFDCFDSL